MTTPCFQKSALFDSEAPDLHAEAKALCVTCPAIKACRENLRATIETFGYDQSTGPRGTWAGKLLAPKQTGRPSRAKAVA